MNDPCEMEIGVENDDEMSINMADLMEIDSSSSMTEISSASENSLLLKHDVNTENEGSKYGDDSLMNHINVAETVASENANCLNEPSASKKYSISKDILAQDGYHSDMLTKRKRALSLDNPSSETSDLADSRRRHTTGSYSYKKTKFCKDSIEIEILLHKAQFFLARSCERNIELAKEKSLWTTHIRSEKLLFEAYRNAPLVVLIFVSKDSDSYSGFAAMCSEPMYSCRHAVDWADYKGGGIIKLSWITKECLPLDQTDHIKNPFNQQRHVYAASDGSEIQRAAGQLVCRLFPFDHSADLKALYFKTIRKKYDKEHARKNPLPSLLDQKITYSDFTNAKRKLLRRNVDELLSRGGPHPLLDLPRKKGRYERCEKDAVDGRNFSLPSLMDITPTLPARPLKHKKALPSLLDSTISLDM